ncbi:SMC-Scp complex subunit ScpB [Wansuia hejianensis]|uniref:Segregation and condensation protein B n=1 Tax=Wansuia hejianensis TaxID=2763667 RepID=A0A926F243_9FIRM|nr:SMC-Scp complex subunit ScpB [Wansuia hejianensis]MBC8590554.1 SMC-Scp complex subunit ScpB [Wansuia hejianensis]
MDDREIKAIIEGLLFTWGDPLNIKDICNILNIDKKRTFNIMKELIDDFDYNRRGLRIVQMEDYYQIGTRPEHYDWIKKLNNAPSKKSLSNAALETLSIIAYRQPVIKSEIEYIRGVKCDRALETLTMKGLIKELGRLEKPGRPIIYGTTEEFLKSFGLQSLDDLPLLEEIEQNLDNIIEE